MYKLRTEMTETDLVRHIELWRTKILPLAQDTRKEAAELFETLILACVWQCLVYIHSSFCECPFYSNKENVEQREEGKGW